MGAATGLDLGLSNMSLVTITVTFHTMMKSSSTLFLLLFASALKLEKPSALRLSALKHKGYCVSKRVT